MPKRQSRLTHLRLMDDPGTGQLSSVVKVLLVVRLGCRVRDAGLALLAFRLLALRLIGTHLGADLGVLTFCRVPRGVQRALRSYPTRCATSRARTRSARDLGFHQRASCAVVGPERLSLRGGAGAGVSVVTCSPLAMRDRSSSTILARSASPTRMPSRVARRSRNSALPVIDTASPNFWAAMRACSMLHVPAVVEYLDAGTRDVQHLAALRVLPASRR